MNKLFLFFAVCLCTILSCTPPSKEKSIDTTAALEADVPYLIANKYFVKNIFQKDQLKNPIIANQTDFDNIFGMATVMGPDGKPTDINFDEQIAIAVILDETDKEMELQPEKLILLNNNKLKLDYKITIGPAMTMTIRPFLLLFIDKKYKDYSIELVSHTANK